MDKTATSSDPSYCCFTIFAICITLFSAAVTFLIANHMYTGMPCHDEPPAEIPPEMKSFGSDRLFLPEKRVVIIKLAGLRRCYILPAKQQQLSVKNFRVVEEALGRPLLRHLSSEEAAKMCDGMSTFLLTDRPICPGPMPRSRVFEEASHLRTGYLVFPLNGCFKTRQEDSL